MIINISEEIHEEDYEGIDEASVEDFVKESLVQQVARLIFDKYKPKEETDKGVKTVSTKLIVFSVDEFNAYVEASKKLRIGVEKVIPKALWQSSK